MDSSWDLTQLRQEVKWSIPRFVVLRECNQIMYISDFQFCADKNFYWRLDSRTLKLSFQTTANKPSKWQNQKKISNVIEILDVWAQDTSKHVFCWSLDHCNFPRILISEAPAQRAWSRPHAWLALCPAMGEKMLCAICDSSDSLNEALDLDLWWISVSSVHPFRLVSWLVDSKCEKSYKTPRCGMVFGMSGCTTQASQTSCLFYKPFSFNETHSILCCIHFKHTWPWESVLSKAGYAFYKVHSLLDISGI